jgi:hypothetical protein
VVFPTEDVLGVEFYLQTIDDPQPLWNLADVSGGFFSVKFNKKITPARIFFRGGHKPK